MAAEHANQWRLNAHAIDLAAELFWRAQSFGGEDAPYESWRGLRDEVRKQRIIRIAGEALVKVLQLAAEDVPDPPVCIFCGRSLANRASDYCPDGVCAIDAERS